jgi:hypothetical protein
MSAVFWAFGLMSLANGIWMLLAPAGWYVGLPAAVPDTGPLNLHFVRDIGAAFSTFGLMLCMAAPQARRRRDVLIAVAIFYVLHALIHVADLATGRLEASHWLIDLPGVFVPAIVLVVLCLPRWWDADLQASSR